MPLIKKLLFILCLLCSLTGCSSYTPNPIGLRCDTDGQVLARCGTMPCTANVIGRCIQQRGCIVHQLECNCVHVIQVGDYVKLVLPADQVFLNKTSVLDPCFYPVLNLVGDFLCCPDKTNIKVAGYTDCCGSCLRNLALSRQQAQAVANYLWRYGIDVRLMYAVGYGGCYPISCNTDAVGRCLNRRVEITLRRITDYYDY